MIDLLTITNLPELAARYDQLPGIRLFLDLERNGKAKRQKGFNTFISNHQVNDIGSVKAVLKQSQLMVRVNPIQMDNLPASKQEVDAVLGQGADMIMLPMFTSPQELVAFTDLAAGRAPISALLETSGALSSVDSWIDTPGLHEVFIGLNDLHLSLGCRFMFEPLLMGCVDQVAAKAQSRGLRFGFGGIARMHEGALSGKAVLAEHVRLGSSAVILSRTFNRADPSADLSPNNTSFENAVAELRMVEQQLHMRSVQHTEDDRLQTAAVIQALVNSAATSAAKA